MAIFSCDFSQPHSYNISSDIGVTILSDKIIYPKETVTHRKVSRYHFLALLVLYRAYLLFFYYLKYSMLLSPNVSCVLRACR